jgi:dTDP-4-dehydrorhamnose 3,5-epimerase
MNIIPTKFSDVLLVEPTVFGDDRGFFYESYSEEVYKVNGIELNFVQDNHSLSQTPGTIRGMHYQLSPKAQTKLVRATRGAIYDVVVDIRKGSSTYGEWEGFILTADNKRQLLVPQGFAHGFCTLVENTEVQYKVDQIYSKEHDRGISWNDPKIGIKWPVSYPILSEKDKNHPTLEYADNNFEWEAIKI